MRKLEHDLEQSEITIARLEAEIGLLKRTVSNQQDIIYEKVFKIAADRDDYKARAETAETMVAELKIRNADHISCYENAIDDREAAETKLLGINKLISKLPTALDSWNHLNSIISAIRGIVKDND